MSSNDPSRRASGASNSEMALVDPVQVAKYLHKDEKLSGKLRIKKSVTKASKAKDAESSLANAKFVQISRSTSPISPLVNENGSSFPTGKASENSPELIQCKHCKKPMEKSVWESHVSLCLQKKQERARKKKEAKEAKARNAKEEAAAKEAKEVKEAKEAKEAKEVKEAKEAKETALEMEKDGDTQMEDPALSAPQVEGEVPDESGAAPSEGITKAAKKGVAKTNGETPKKSKKRKADAEGGEKEPKKKKTKKDEPPKPKVPKPKGPVDVEKQCGVALENGAHCARSLTCKSHSMGAKRGVPGRSLPYDTLLQQYQKKNQAKQQKAAMDANAPLMDDLDTNGPVDSDEEKDAVMAAVARSCPRPLEQHVFVPINRKYQLVRMKEMLGNALGGRTLFGAGPSYPSVAAATSLSSSSAPTAATVTAESTADAGGGNAGGDSNTSRRASFIDSRQNSVTLALAGSLQRSGSDVHQLPPGSRKTSLASAA